MVILGGVCAPSVLAAAWQTSRGCPHLYSRRGKTQKEVMAFSGSTQLVRGRVGIQTLTRDLVGVTATLLRLPRAGMLKPWHSQGAGGMKKGWGNSGGLTPPVPSSWRTCLCTSLPSAWNVLAPASAPPLWSCALLTQTPQHTSRLPSGTRSQAHVDLTSRPCSLSLSKGASAAS